MLSDKRIQRTMHLNWENLSNTTLKNHWEQSISPKKSKRQKQETRPSLWGQRWLSHQTPNCFWLFTYLVCKQFIRTQERFSTNSVAVWVQKVLLKCMTAQNYMDCIEAIRIKWLGVQELWTKMSIMPARLVVYRGYWIPTRLLLISRTICSLRLDKRWMSTILSLTQWLIKVNWFWTEKKLFQVSLDSFRNNMEVILTHKLLCLLLMKQLQVEGAKVVWVSQSRSRIDT